MRWVWSVAAAAVVLVLGLGYWMLTRRELPLGDGGTIHTQTLRPGR